jgi:hypothetical protein
VGCSRRHAKSFPNNHGHILRLQIVLQAVSENTVAPAAPSLAGQSGYLCSLSLHSDPPVASQGEVLTSTTRNSFLCSRTKDSGLPAKTVAGRGPVCRTNKLCLARGCRGMNWFTGGLCRRHSTSAMPIESCRVGKDKSSCLLQKDQKNRKTTSTHQFK